MTAVVVAMFLLAAAAAAGVPIVRWWSDRRLSTRELPPLLIPFRTGERSVNPVPVGVRHAAPVAEVRPSVAPALPALPALPAATPTPTPIIAIRRADAEVPVEVVRGDVPIPAAEQALLDEDDREAASTETIRFRRPNEEPIQLLPGRLEVLAGDGNHREIRFVRVPGEPMQLILGREAGPSAQYVALKSGTVSRRHARFAFSNGRWAVANLSKTNPVVVNDEELTHIEGERPLMDGDCLELGEVVLRFRAR